MGDDIGIGEKRDDPPQWSTQLESFYDAYHPLAFVLLEQDDADDQRLGEAYQS